MYLHMHGDFKKIAAFCVKQFELVSRDEESAFTENKEVMLKCVVTLFNFHSKNTGDQR